MEYHFQGEIKYPMINALSPNKLTCFLFDLHLSIFQT